MNTIRNIAVIGLGYVGIHVAMAFARDQPVIAFDINQTRINKLKEGIDHTNEFSKQEIEKRNLILTYNSGDLQSADFYIVAVPTPVRDSNQPDLQILLHASEMIGSKLSKGDIIVYESTVYPGTTENECAPVLERTSGLRSGEDFFVAYSPERINPGDKKHTFINSVKIVSGQNDETLQIVSNVYRTVISAGVYEAASIQIAETAKVIENSQRDLNIAFMNELAIILHRLNIDTQSVLEAAKTKWNFLPFVPGLVGGHCIGVDPYYLTYKAESTGYHPEVILAGRRVNDGMGNYIAEQTVKLLTKNGVDFEKNRVGILGFTFKENCTDIRNTQVVNIVHELNEYSLKTLVHDPYADSEEVYKEYGITITSLDDFKDLTALILAVAHEQYLEMFQTKVDSLVSMLLNQSGVILDVKSLVDKEALKKYSIIYWRL